MPPPANSPSWHRPSTATSCINFLPEGINHVSWGSHLTAGPGAVSWTIKKLGQPIPLCNESNRKADSTENLNGSIQAAITSIGARHATFATAFRSLTGKSFPPINLNLFPVYEDSRKGPTNFVTDNASYDPQTSRISLFPSSNTHQGKVHLWMTPFVHAHEMAHHVIDTLRIMRKLPDSQSDENDESIADVLAFLALDSKPELVRELPGFGVDRDPSWPFFFDGTPKANSTAADQKQRKAAVLAHLMLMQLPSRDVSHAIKVLLLK